MSLQDVECKKCDFKQRFAWGITASLPIADYVFFGCRKCKKIISLETHDKKNNRAIKTKKCPNCNSDLIDYVELCRQQGRKEKYIYPCPACGEDALEFVKSVRT